VNTPWLQTHSTEFQNYHDRSSHVSSSLLKFCEIIFHRFFGFFSSLCSDEYRGSGAYFFFTVCCESIVFEFTELWDRFFVSMFRIIGPFTNDVSFDSEMEATSFNFSYHSGEFRDIFLSGYCLLVIDLFAFIYFRKYFYFIILI